MQRTRARRARSAPEPAGPPGELEERGVERLRPEVRPQHLGRVELGVGGLPDQEVRQALLAAGPDDEVGVGQAGGVEGGRRSSASSIVSAGDAARRDQAPDRVDELGPAGVVEGDVQEQPVAAGGLARAPRRSSGGCPRAAPRARPRSRTRTPWRAQLRASRSGWPARAGRRGPRPPRRSGPSSRG